MEIVRCDACGDDITPRAITWLKLSHEGLDTTTFGDGPNRDSHFHNLECLGRWVDE